MLPPSLINAANETQNSPLSASEKSAATSASDFDSFLKLLTAQLRNQDPLSPLDSTQFVEQLASFSAVEQQIQTNSLLEQVAAGLSSSGLSEATPWIGKEVETPSSIAEFSGEPLSFIIPGNSAASRTEVAVLNSSGETVFQKSLDNSRQSFVWGGEGADGAVAPAGTYTISVNSYSDDELVGAGTPIAVSVVREARLDITGVKLVLESGAVVDQDAITAVRDVEPASSAEETL